MNSKWRSTDWPELKGLLKTEDIRLQEIVDRVIEFGATAILEAYFNSDEFGEDASGYCRCQGWTEPH